jgi:pimeloyl-ACP methyl ester carboxylesterase
VLVHGITGTGLNWGLFAERLGAALGPGAVRVLAPDLRGRGDSPVRPDRLGLDGHVEDLAELIAGLPAPPVVVGHSMGGAVVALLGARHPEAVRGLVLTDGGLSLPMPDGMGQADIDATLRAVLGPAMARLETTFADFAAYLDFFADHPSVGPLLAGPHAAHVRRYLQHDLRPSQAVPGRFASACVLEAIRADGRDVLSHPMVASAVPQAVDNHVPIEFLWASRGLMNEPQGLYDPQRLQLLQVPAAVRVAHVEDTNHYSIVLDTPGVDRVLDAVARLS